MNSVRTVAKALVALAFLNACGNANVTKNQTPDTVQTVSPEGWSQIVITANFAKTTLDGLAHFSTTRNACGRDAAGVVDLSIWNRLAEILNRSTAATPLREPRCTAFNRATKMDGTAELTTPQGKRLVLEVRGSEFCSSLPDSALASDLFDLISQVVTVADKEECPNGWGSG